MDCCDECGNNCGCCDFCGCFKGYSLGLSVRLSLLSVVIVGSTLGFTLLANERLNGDFEAGRLTGGIVMLIVACLCVYYLVGYISLYYMENVVRFNAAKNANAAPSVSKLQSMTISRRAQEATILWVLLWIGFYFTVLTISNTYVLAMGSVFLIFAGIGTIFWLIDE